MVPTSSKKPLFEVIKRNGDIVAFDKTKIETAVKKAMFSVQKLDEKVAVEIAQAVKEKLWSDIFQKKIFTPTIEDVQDEVEIQLMLRALPKVAKAYILYRAEQAKFRNETTITPSPHVKELAEKSNHHVCGHRLNPHTHDEPASADHPRRDNHPCCGGGKLRGFHPASSRPQP